MSQGSLPPAFRLALAIGLAAPLWLAACRQAPGDHKPTVPVNVADLVPGTIDTKSGISATDASPAPPGGSPANNAATPTLSPDAQKGEAGARAVLRTWADALERGDWTAARAQWGHGGEDSGLDPDAFVRPWQRYTRLAIHLDEGAIEGAAASLYYAAPVTIEGTLRDGRFQQLVGQVTLRRANDVDGASAADLTWHILRSDLRPTP